MRKFESNKISASSSVCAAGAGDSVPAEEGWVGADEAMGARRGGEPNEDAEGEGDGLVRARREDPGEGAEAGARDVVVALRRAREFGEDH